MLSNRILFSVSFITLFSGIACANLSPVAALRIGANWTDWGQDGTVQAVEGFISDSYLAEKTTQTNFGGGAFLGGEWHNQQSPWRLQMGISYDTFLVLIKKAMCGNLASLI